MKPSGGLLALAWAFSALVAAPALGGADCPPGSTCIPARLPSGEVREVQMGFPPTTSLDARPLERRAGWLDLFSFQVGAFLDPVRGEALASELRLHGIPAFLSRHEATRAGDRTKVLVGEYLSYPEAKEAAVEVHRKQSLPYSINIWKKIEGVLPDATPLSATVAVGIVLVTLDRDLRRISALGEFLECTPCFTKKDKGVVEGWAAGELLDLRLGTLIVRRFADATPMLPPPARKLLESVEEWIAKAGKDPVKALRSAPREAKIAEWSEALRTQLDTPHKEDRLRVLSARYEDGGVLVEGIEGKRPVFLLLSSNGRLSSVLYNQGYAEALSARIHLIDLDGDGDPEVVESAPDGGVRIYRRGKGIDRIVWSAGADLGEPPAEVAGLEWTREGPFFLLVAPSGSEPSADGARLLPYAPTRGVTLRITAPSEP